MPDPDMYRIKQYREPEYLYTIVTNQNIRGNINIPPNALTLYKKSFGYRGPDAFNKLRQNIKSAKNLISFKRQVRTWIFSNVNRFIND